MNLQSEIESRREIVAQADPRVLVSRAEQMVKSLISIFGDIPPFYRDREDMKGKILEDFRKNPEKACPNYSNCDTFVCPGNFDYHKCLKYQNECGGNRSLQLFKDK